VILDITFGIAIIRFINKQRWIVSKTRHIQKRMSERGINDQTLNLISKYGVKQGDKVILNKKCCEKLEVVLKGYLEQVRKAIPRGGFVLVEDKGVMITTYELNSFKRGVAAND